MAYNLPTWIFLDIDGVLVPDSMHDEMLEGKDILKFNPKCLREFENVLRRHPNLLVVISSSWREIFPFEEILPLFSPDIIPRVVGFTPFLDCKIIHQFKYLRHQEVLEYLLRNQALDAFWVAIDDIAEHYPPDAPIVVTDPDIGFDEQAALVLELYLSLT